MSEKIKKTYCQVALHSPCLLHFLVLYSFNNNKTNLMLLESAALFFHYLFFDQMESTRKYEPINKFSVPETSDQISTKDGMIGKCNSMV